ncbi:MAG: hypothetical protein CMI56_00685 [Parcubacteria group bacterium]|nr:hypothetical protein [Parcubacteria group bacterium]
MVWLLLAKQIPRFDSDESFQKMAKVQMKKQDSIELAIRSTEEVEAEIAREEREDAMKLAKETNDLKEAMADLHAIVKKDQNKLEKIVDEVDDAKETVNTAADHLVSAAELDKSARKKKCICMSVIFLMLLITVILIWRQVDD